MLDRPPSGRAATPGALRARKSRARHRAGIAVLQVKVHRRRLAAAVRAANRGEPDPEVLAEIEAAAQLVLDDWIDRWLKNFRARDGCRCPCRTVGPP
jgi:hypothetical protein